VSRQHTVNGGEKGSSSFKALKRQSLLPLGRSVLPLLPERPSQLVMGAALGRWPQLWGLSAAEKGVGGARRAFQRAFPSEDVDEFLARWVRARGQGMATSLNYLSRWLRGRDSHLVELASQFELPKGPHVVAFLHYSIDPMTQLVCLSGNQDDLSIRWPIYPMEGGVEDDREMWLTGNTVPPHIDEMFLPVTDPRWLAVAFGHLSQGGTVFIAIDAPFDSNSRPRKWILIGQARLPIAPSIEMFARVKDVQLTLAWPRPESRSSWLVDTKHVDDVDELAQLAGAWIESHHEHWAGWPFVVWREKAMMMRERNEQKWCS
jgi:hypothetical protein